MWNEMNQLPLFLHLWLFVSTVVGKYPLVFFSIKSLNGLLRQNVIAHCITNILETGAELCGITFDGESANCTAANLLGANLGSNVGVPKYFTLPLAPMKRKFVVMPDPCHMLKNIRNAFGDYKLFINNNGERIEWQFLEELIILQEKEELHLGNKLRRARIFFRNQK